MIFRSLFLLTTLGIGQMAYAFPQLTTHGYPSCTACHVSPTGGGMLTAYGRSLSRELLSQFGAEGEEKPLYGALSLPEWAGLGGDVRTLQYYLNNPRVEQARFIFMQADLEGAYLGEKWQVLAGIGYQNSLGSTATTSSVLSRRHYVQWRYSENQSVRLGKFETAYGIRWPDHFLFARRDLGFDAGYENYHLEWNGLFDAWEATLSLNAGRPDSSSLDGRVEKGLNGRATYTFADKNQIGWSTYYGKNDLRPRLLFGPFVTVALSEKLSLFAEVDWQRLMGGNSQNSWGFTQNLRLNFEMLKGLHLFAWQEYAKLDLRNPALAKHAYTLGAQWFFRPHVELAGGIRRQINASSPSFTTDSAWLLFHYYL